MGNKSVPASPGLLPGSIQLRQQRLSTLVLKPGRRPGERVTGRLTCGILHGNQQEPITAAGLATVKLFEYRTKEAGGGGVEMCSLYCLGGLHLGCEKLRSGDLWGEGLRL